MKAIMDMDYTLEDEKKLGDMATSLLRAIWVRDGYTEGGVFDTFWDEVFDEALMDGTKTLPRADFERCLQEYYQQRGWKNGVPTRATLEKNGLKDVADDLAARNLLPA